MQSVALAGIVQRAPSSQTWIERPWEIRYVLIFDTADAVKRSLLAVKELDLEDRNSGRLSTYRNYEYIFSPTSILKPLRRGITHHSDFAIIVINFDKLGFVATQNSSGMPLRGRLSGLNDIVLAGTDADPRPFYLADWFWGVPGDGAVFSPGVCLHDDQLRYEDDFIASKFSLQGNFGCREWTHELYYGRRPYIDVTSYQKDGANLKEFIGWARFQDLPKPVIGKHDRTWYCLHECPAAEPPGAIPDIVKWTKMHGFPLPRKPKKAPMFPDKDYPPDYDD